MLTDASYAHIEHSAHADGDRASQGVIDRARAAVAGDHGRRQGLHHVPARPTCTTSATSSPSTDARPRALARSAQRRGLPAAVGQGRAVADVGAAHRRGRRPVRAATSRARSPTAVDSADHGWLLDPPPLTVQRCSGSRPRLARATSMASALVARAVDHRVLERDLDRRARRAARPRRLAKCVDVDRVDLARVDPVLRPRRRSGRATAGRARPGRFLTSGCRKAWAQRSNHSPQCLGHLAVDSGTHARPDEGLEPRASARASGASSASTLT